MVLLAPWLSISVLGGSPVQAQVGSSIAQPATGGSFQTTPKAAPVRSGPAPGLDDGAYIDSTNYSIGATQSEAPKGSSDSPSVILSERSTGRQTVLKPGQSVSKRLYGSASASGRASRAAAPKGWISRAAAQTSPGRVSRAARTSTRFQRGRFYGSSAARYSSSSTPSVKVGPLALSNQGIHLKIASGMKNLKLRGSLPGDSHLVFPLAIPATITSAFGWRIHPISGAQRFHTGTDLGAPLGTPVLAAYAGKVAIADFLGGYGLSVVLRHHEDQRETRYAHLSEVLVQSGEWVEQGSIIGRVGSTGNSTGPHLHFELLQATPEGWAVTDPGEQLEYSLAQLVRVLKTAQVKPQPKS